MRRALRTIVAAGAVIAIAACGGAEDTETDMTEDLAPAPPVTAPVDTMTPDTTMIDTMMDTTTDTLGTST